MVYIIHFQATMKKETKKIKGKLFGGEYFFTTQQVFEILEINAERLRQWMKLGYVIPSKKATGSGKKHYFSKYQIYSIAIFKALLDIGLNRWISSQFVKDIKDEQWFDISRGESFRYMIVTGEAKRSKNWKDSLDVEVAPDRGSALEKDDEIAIIVNIHEITSEIREKIE